MYSFNEFNGPNWRTDLMFIKMKLVKYLLRYSPNFYKISIWGFILFSTHFLIVCVCRSSSPAPDLLWPERRPFRRVHTEPSRELLRGTPAGAVGLEQWCPLCDSCKLLVASPPSAPSAPFRVGYFKEKHVSLCVSKVLSLNCFFLTLPTMEKSPNWAHCVDGSLEHSKKGGFEFCSWFELWFAS